MEETASGVQALKGLLLPRLDKLLKQVPDVLPFKEPVDPVRLGVPDYYEIIQHPMDLGTVRTKLLNCEYKEPWGFIDDIYKVWDNAWLYNKKDSKVYRQASKLAEMFEQEMKSLMEALGYCCGTRRSFTPTPLFCVAKDVCMIPAYAKFHFYNEFVYCDKCFNAARGTLTPWSDEEQCEITIPKDAFITEFNDTRDVEPMVSCKICGLTFHNICVMYMELFWPKGFTCDRCLKTTGKVRLENPFSARNLRSTVLGSFIEDRVNFFLRREEPEANKVIIRVVGVYDKTVNIYPKMEEAYVETGKVQPPFPYRMKVIHAFQNIEGADVCFFCMIVQEYGSECPSPNTRRVYISYLDSINLFRPRRSRTAVYHEIMLGYLNYIGKLGYTTAHLWACPPEQGKDYIFYCHPPEQKFPKSKRLQDWYSILLQKGINENMVLNFKNIVEYLIEENVTHLAQLPYFEGDYVQIGIDDCITEFENEAEAAKKHNTGSKKKGKRNSSEHNKSLTATFLNEDEVSLKMMKLLNTNKNQFFVIRLYPTESAAALGPIIDPDPLDPCTLMNGRDPFLILARENHLEFSSLRRAKHSTMGMLYQIHFLYTSDLCSCNICDKHMSQRNGFHCTVCPDFDLCTACYESQGHDHPEIQPQLEVIEKEPILLNSLDVIAHCYKCSDKSCAVQDCSQFKIIINHIKNCDLKIKGGCPVCTKFVCMLGQHSKKCIKTDCEVPFCRAFKIEKRRRQQMQERSAA